jgi:nitrogen fixation NifU-like protein
VADDDRSRRETIEGHPLSYSDKLLQYFLDPAHAGEMERPDGVGSVGDIACGDFFEMYIRVSDGRMTEISYQIFGCPAAIATCEAVAEMAAGKTLEEACLITDRAVVEFLGGLPETKLHCSNSAAEALRRAVADYLLRHSAGQSAMQNKEESDHATR